MRFKLFAVLMTVAVFLSMDGADAKDQKAKGKPGEAASEEAKEERAQLFAQYDKQPETDSLKTQLEELAQKQSELEVELKKKEEPLREEVKAASEEYEKQALAVRDHARNMPGENATQAQIAAYDKESDKLNAWGKDLNARRDDFKKELDEIWQPYDELEKQRKNLQAKLTGLERYNKQAKNCKTMVDNEAAKKCLDTLSDTFNSTVD